MALQHASQGGGVFGLNQELQLHQAAAVRAESYAEEHMRLRQSSSSSAVFESSEQSNVQVLHVCHTQAEVLARGTGASFLLLTLSILNQTKSFIPRLFLLAES